MGHCVKGDLKQAMEVFREMQSKSLVNDCIVYNTLLDGCVKLCQWDLADEILEDLERSGVAQSSFTLGILVKMHGRRRQLDKAFQLFEELPKKWGFCANERAKTCLVSACILNNALPVRFSCGGSARPQSHIQWT